MGIKVKIFKIRIITLKDFNLRIFYQYLILNSPFKIVELTLFIKWKYYSRSNKNRLKVYFPYIMNYNEIL